MVAQVGHKHPHRTSTKHVNAHSIRNCPHSRAVANQIPLVVMLLSAIESHNRTTRLDTFPEGITIPLYYVQSTIALLSVIEHESGCRAGRPRRGQQRTSMSVMRVETIDDDDGNNAVTVGRTASEDDNQGTIAADGRMSVESVVRRMDAVRSNDELLGVLESLRRQLLADPTDDEQGGSAAQVAGGDEDEEGEEVGTGGAQFRQALATALLRRAIFSSGTATGKVQQALHAVLLEGCGVGNTLFAAMEVVAAAAANASTNGAAPADAACFPDAALSMISLVLLRSEDHLVRLLNTLPTVTERPSSSDLDDNEHQMRAAFLDAWCGQVVLFGRVISNACRSHRHPLPPWAAASSSSSSGWEPRLVDCAIRACCHRLRLETLGGATSGTSIANIDDPQDPVEVVYLRGLLRILLSRGGASTGADAAAVGIRRACNDSHRLGRSDPSMIYRAVLGALLNGVPNRRRSRGGPSIRSFSSMQLAPLCRALMLMELTKQASSQSESKEVEDSGSDSKEESWECAIVRTLLASSRDAQDLFVQQVLLASSVPLIAATSVARLLHSIETSEALDECDGASDEEDDGDDISSSDHRSPLLRQVHRVALLWSSALSNGIQVHQQHVTTLFLQESLKTLSDAGGPTSGDSSELDPDSPSSSGAANDAAPNMNLLDALTATDTLVTLMNGVSQRLHSTDPEIRRDGMRVGQALGEHVLHQPVVFDELNALEAETKNEVSPHRSQDRPASPSPKQSSTLGRRLVHRRRPRRRQTDPDALYVSDSETSRDDSAGNDAESTGGWSDDSDWDEDEYKNQRYSVDDDEEDLREVPLPLYLQDCLDLLRMSETVDGAVASHLAALQALPKLVRERPGDLADFGPLIAKQLVAMENKFQLDDFDAMVQLPLCALVAEEPLIVGTALIEDMFQDGSLYNRTMALTALNEGAWELSGNKLRENNDERMLYVLILSVSLCSYASSILTLLHCQSPAGSTSIRQECTSFI